MRQSPQQKRTKLNQEVRKLRVQVAALKEMQVMLDKQKQAAARKLLKAKGYLK